jgi:hypothetical protein
MKYDSILSVEVPSVLVNRRKPEQHREGDTMFKSGSGIGRLSGAAERSLRRSTQENFAKRAEKLGKFPGTHTLGKEFETVEKSQ